MKYPSLRSTPLVSRRLRCSLIAIAIVTAVTMLAAPATQAQTYSVLHNFSGMGDGGNPYVGLTMDAAGRLYGTTYNGGNSACTGGCGTVFQLKHSGSGWVLNPLYEFQGGNDGAHPYSRISIAQDGTLYGTTYSGGGSGCGGAGCGTVFHLRPSPSVPHSALSPWNEQLIHNFTGGLDGANPQGDLTLDSSGNIYGTTLIGGGNGSRCSFGGCGVVYELSHSGSGWTENILYSVSDSQFYNPYGGVVFDAAGNLYGVLSGGGLNRAGAVYQLSHSGSGWTEQTVYAFTGQEDGGNPTAGLIIDGSGNLFGTTNTGGDLDNEDGTAFKISPATGGGWNYTVIAVLGPFTPVCACDKLYMDADGNLYGTAEENGGGNRGFIYKNFFTWLHSFGGSDGANPMSVIVADADGNFYGTATHGGTSGTGCGGQGCGVVWELTP